MSVEQTACMHRGNTFFGEFEAIDDGLERVVRVRYHGQELQAKCGATLPEVTAYHLLKELVVLEAVEMKAAEAERALARCGTGAGTSDAGYHTHPMQ